MGAEAKGNNLIKDDPKIYAALIDGFTKGYTDLEACLAAGICTATLYAYTEQFPEFTQHKENLKHTPTLTAKSTVVADLPKNVKTAKWYLEHKSDEFKPKPDTQINQLFIGTDAQMKAQLAAKLGKYLLVQDSDSHEDVTDAEVVTDE